MDSTGIASEKVSVRGSGKKMFPSRTRAGDFASACATQPRRHMLKNTSSCREAAVPSCTTCGHVITAVSSEKSATAFAKRRITSGLFQTDADHLHQAKRIARCGEAGTKPVIERHRPAFVDRFREVHQDS